MHFCHENEKTVTGPICSRIVALYHQNSQLMALHEQIYGRGYWALFFKSLGKLQEYYLRCANLNKQHNFQTAVCGR
jgi:hypothetical protein